MKALLCSSWVKWAFSSRLQASLSVRFSSRLLPDVRTDAVKLDEEPEEHGDLHRVEAVLGARFPVSTRNLVILTSSGIMGPK